VPSTILTNRQNGKTYIGSNNYFYEPAGLIRLDSTGKYDNVTLDTSYRLTAIEEIHFDPSTDNNIITFGYCLSYWGDSIELNIKSEGKKSIDLSITGSKIYTLKKVHSAGQDYSGWSYINLLSHGNDTAIGPYIFAVKQNYNGHRFKVKTNLPQEANLYWWRTNRKEDQNKLVTYDGPSNGLAANDQYIFYTDGSYLTAIDKQSRKTILTPYALPTAGIARSSGIAADPCNHVFVGGDSGNIFCFSFDGSSFTMDSQILVMGQKSPRYVHDIKYNPSTGHLFATGDSFVGSFITPYRCNDTSLNINQSPVCGSKLYAVLNHYDTASTYTFQWYDSTLNKEVQTKSVKYRYGDTFSKAQPFHNYKLRIYRNIRIGGYYRDYPFKVFPRFDTTLYVSICQGDSFVHLGNSYASSMVINDTFQNQYGCDSAQQIRLKVLSRSFTFDTLRICQGDSVMVFGSYRNSAGTYRDTLINFLGCDSIRTVDIYVKPDTLVQVWSSICRGEIYRIGKNQYTRSGVYLDSFLRASGCDSVVETHLSVLRDTLVTINASICLGDSVAIANRWRISAGSGRDTLLRSNGCDSVIAWQVRVNQPATTSFFAHLCPQDSVQLGGRTFNDSGNFRYPLKTYLGCDSIVVVTVTKSYFSTDIALDSSQKPNLLAVRNGSGDFQMGNWWWYGDGNLTGESPSDSVRFFWPSDDQWHQMKLLEQDRFGCRDSAEIQFFSPAKSIKFYNIFTPNGDGLNDLLEFDTKGGDFTYSFYVFNRWGERVFAAENASILDNTQLWNGNVDNGMVQCPEGSYFAQLYTNFTANPQNIPTKPISFVITLIR
jgi:gliding motility-associated-like protein